MLNGIDCTAISQTGFFFSLLFCFSFSGNFSFFSRSPSLVGSHFLLSTIPCCLFNDVRRRNKMTAADQERCTIRDKRVKGADQRPASSAPIQNSSNMPVNKVHIKLNTSNTNGCSCGAEFRALPFYLPFSFRVAYSIYVYDPIVIHVVDFLSIHNSVDGKCFILIKKKK